MAGLTALTTIVFGLETSRAYFIDILPPTARYRSDWHNLSLPGWWRKRLDPQKTYPPVEIQALADNTTLAITGSLVSAAALLAVLAVRLAPAGERARVTRGDPWGVPGCGGDCRPPAASGQFARPPRQGSR